MFAPIAEPGSPPARPIARLGAPARFSVPAMGAWRSFPAAGARAGADIVVTGKVGGRAKGGETLRRIIASVKAV